MEKLAGLRRVWPRALDERIGIGNLPIIEVFVSAESFSLCFVALFGHYQLV
jgi:hypothetical protein